MSVGGIFVGKGFSAKNSFPAAVVSEPLPRRSPIESDQLAGPLCCVDPPRTFLPSPASAVRFFFFFAPDYLVTRLLPATYSTIVFLLHCPGTRPANLSLSTPSAETPNREQFAMASALRIGSSALRTSLRSSSFTARGTAFNAVRCYSAKSQVSRRPISAGLFDAPS